LRCHRAERRYAGATTVWFIGPIDNVLAVVQPKPDGQSLSQTCDI
jgi:hypothetical protein